MKTPLRISRIPSLRILFIHTYIHTYIIYGRSPERGIGPAHGIYMPAHRTIQTQREISAPSGIINHVSSFRASFEHTPYLSLSMSSALQSTETQTVPLYRPTACNISHIDKTLRMSVLQRIRFHSTQSISVFFFVQAISGTVNSIPVWQLHVYRMGHRHTQSIRTKIKLSNNFQSSITRAKFHRNPSCDLRDKTLRADGRNEGKCLK